MVVSNMKGQTKHKSFSKEIREYPPIIETSTPIKNNSKTKVHFSEKGAYKYIIGERLPITIRINKGLYKRFKPLAKRVYGSVCRAVEIYMVSVIEAVENGVHFSNTEKPINIDKIVIERNIRTRRKLEVDEEVTERTVEIVVCDFCGKPGVVASFEHKDTGMIKRACGYHAKSLRARKDWLEVTV